MVKTTDRFDQTLLLQRLSNGFQGTHLNLLNGFVNQLVGFFVKMFRLQKGNVITNLFPDHETPDQGIFQIDCLGRDLTQLTAEWRNSLPALSSLPSVVEGFRFHFLLTF